jgi:hypothetical protein
VDSGLRLPGGHQLPVTRIVQAHEVRVHEDPDPQRVKALTQRLKEEQVLRNPPVAAPLPRGGFVVLDGANRTAALQSMSVPFHVLQLVDYASPTIRLEVWNHLLTADGAARDAASEGEVARLRNAEELEDGLRTGALACGVVTPAAVLGVVGPGNQQGRIQVLRRVVAGYAGRVQIYRVPTADLTTLRAEYGEVAAVIVFPRFSKEDILALADLPERLPTGITRHIIPNRVLRLNVPLSLLRDAGSIPEKNEALQDLIRARLLAHRVRYYAEPTLLFDE